MNASLRWRSLLSLIVLVVALIYVLPSFPSVKNSALGKYLPDDSISLGLDLKGGIHLTLGVDMDKALENSLVRMGEDMKAEAMEEGIVFLKPTVIGNQTLELTLLKKEQGEKVKEITDNYKNALTVSETKPLDNGKVLYVFTLVPDYKKFLEKMTIDQALKTIRNRIDQFGVSEPDIRRQQGNRIQVQLPGLSDPERAIKIIGRTAHLEFKIVDDNADPAKAEKGIVGPGREVLPQVLKNPDGSSREVPIVVKKNAVMTGEYITDAQTRFDSYNQPYVTVDFDRRGGRIFERVTADNVKKRMAIILDGKVYSAPVIQEKIAGGSCSISGHFTTDDAHDLAIVLRAGSLPAPVSILEQRTVGPSLGQESIDKGVKSALLGSALVLVFMVIYYGFAGVVADMVLVLNIIMIMAGLAMFGATLTLPGIAGIILTIGMAVDANVIIFERIREELKRGLSSASAIQEGYSRATITILDANVTTILAAIILYQFGTGPIRGFAVTLSLGILCSMFTAIFVSRVLFDYKVSGSQAKLSI